MKISIVDMVDFIQNVLSILLNKNKFQIKAASVPNGTNSYDHYIFEEKIKKDLTTFNVKIYQDKTSSNNCLHFIIYNIQVNGSYMESWDIRIYKNYEQNIIKIFKIFMYIKNKNIENNEFKKQIYNNNFLNIKEVYVG